MKRITLSILVALAAIVILIIVSISAVADSHILYAKPTGTGNDDCSSWDDACDLQTALGNADYGEEIWIAEGVHKPTGDQDRTVSFQLESGVIPYGGFAGTSGSEGDFSSRDSETYLTVLSGDIGTPNDSSDNSYHVVSSTGVTWTAGLDGFTITGGNANGDYPHWSGAGMWNDEAERAGSQ